MVDRMITLTGQKVTLRAPEPGDLDALYLWENDPELWPYGSARAPLSRHQLWQYIDSYDGDIFSARQLRLMIIENSSSKTVGTIDLSDFDPRDAHANVGIFVNAAHRNKGYALEALKLLIDFSAKTIGLHQLAALIASDNIPSIKLFKSAGFKSCGCLRSWVKIGRKYSDVLLFQRLNEV